MMPLRGLEIVFAIACCFVLTALAFMFWLAGAGAL